MKRQVVHNNPLHLLHPRLPRAAALGSPLSSASCWATLRQISSNSFLAAAPLPSPAPPYRARRPTVAGRRRYGNFPLRLRRPPALLVELVAQHGGLAVVPAAVDVEGTLLGAHRVRRAFFTSSGNSGRFLPSASACSHATVAERPRYFCMVAIYWPLNGRNWPSPTVRVADRLETTPLFVQPSLGRRPPRFRGTEQYPNRSSESRETGRSTLSFSSAPLAARPLQDIDWASPLNRFEGDTGKAES
jgi:hypothetical protein